MQTEQLLLSINLSSAIIDTRDQRSANQIHFFTTSFGGTVKRPLFEPRDVLNTHT